MLAFNFKLKKTIYFLFSLFISINVFSQNDPVRIEIPVKFGYAPINMHILPNKEICLFYPSAEATSSDSIVWSFNVLNESLKTDWLVNFVLKKKATFIKSFNNKNNALFVFHDNQTSDKLNVSLVSLNFVNQEITIKQSSIPAKVEVSDIELINDKLWIGFNQRKDSPGVVGISIDNDEVNKIEFSEKNSVILDIAPQHENKGVCIVYKVLEKQNINHLKIKNCNNSGVELSQLNIPTTQNWKIVNSAQYIATSLSSGLIAGSYGYNDKSSRKMKNYVWDDYNYYNYYYRNTPYDYLYDTRYDANTDETPISDGYFTCAIKQGSADSINFFSFSNFNQPHSYITDQEAIVSGMSKQKSSKRNRRNTESSFGLRLITHNLRFVDNEFILVAETYYPEYTSSNRGSYDFYGRYYPDYYYYFEGYRYSNAFIASFDNNGKLKWNNGMEMRGVLTKVLNKRLEMLQNDDEMVLFFNANNKIAFKMIKNEKVTESLQYSNLAKLWGTDNFQNEYLSSIKYWYDDYFLAFGYQQILNNHLSKPERTVFYIQKIAFR